MRLVFAGTPRFAVPALEALLAAGHQVPLVLTQPDRPSGRGLKLTPSAVAATAARHGIPTSKRTSLKSAEAIDELREARPDVMVVAAYGLLLPQSVLDLPSKGCLNIHASLLPRWRGAAPIQRAILAGDERTGVTIMQMEAGLDTGPTLLERAVAIAPTDTTGTLTDKLSVLGAGAIVEALSGLPALTPRRQDSSFATYATKISKSEATIDWAAPATQVARVVRAFNPSPGAEGVIRSQRIKVWEAYAIDTSDLSPGEVSVRAPGDLTVGCGHGSLRLVVVQRPGGRRLGVEEFLRGNPWPEGASNALSG